MSVGTVTSKRGIGAHQSAQAETVVWLTPPYVLDALGPFDLDPCACTDRPWDTAARHYTAEDDGLAQTWDGFVWMNPPHGKAAGAWLERLAGHGNGIALVFARTETAAFANHVWPKATALLFLDGRLSFHYPDGTKARANGGAPSVLIAYGEEAAKRLRTSGLAGAYVDQHQVLAAA